MTAAGSYRDPENAAFRHGEVWYRIASPTSAQALDQLTACGLKDELVAEGALLGFTEADPATTAAVIAAYREAAGRRPVEGARVFAVDTIALVTYPWEWPNALLSAAALHTLAVRERLLEHGLDLKDAAAANVQFNGVQPCFVDLGSIEMWRPNPGWNGTRQFVEQFVNPLAVGTQEHITSADAWELGHRRGLRSDVARAAMPKRLRRRLSLTILQASTKPRPGNAPSETRFAGEAQRNPELAKKASLGLTAKLRGHIEKLGKASHETTWAGYGSREHYGSGDLDTKADRSVTFVKARTAGIDNPLVLDVGGNDGMTAGNIVAATSARAVVMDADAGALDALCRALETGGATERARITPLIGDLTNLTTGSGLLGAEWDATVDRIRPDAVLCQAVLHHVVITQGTPMQLAVDALAAFGAPLQIELATPEDEKVRLLLSQIPNWSGDYSVDALVAALQRRYATVEVVGTTSATRVVVEAWN